MKSKNPKEIIEIEINKTTESRPDTEEEPKLLPDSTVETELTETELTETELTESELTETKLTETELLRTSLDDEDINLLKDSLDKETQVDEELKEKSEEDEIKEDNEVSEDNTSESEFIKGIKK